MLELLLQVPSSTYILLMPGCYGPSFPLAVDPDQKHVLLTHFCLRGTDMQFNSLIPLLSLKSVLFENNTTTGQVQLVLLIFFKSTKSLNTVMPHLKMHINFILLVMLFSLLQGDFFQRVVGPILMEIKKYCIKIAQVKGCQ